MQAKTGRRSSTISFAGNIQDLAWWRLGYLIEGLAFPSRLVQVASRGFFQSNLGLSIILWSAGENLQEEDLTSDLWQRCWEYWKLFPSWWYLCCVKWFSFSPPRSYSLHFVLEGGFSEMCIFPSVSHCIAVQWVGFRGANVLISGCLLCHKV